MSIAHNANAVTDGLLLAIDAANPRSLRDVPGYRDAGIGDWFCIASGTATYSAPIPGTTIYQKDSGGNTSIVISNTTIPQRGTFSVIAGYTYWGNKPIHLVIESKNGYIIPFAAAGTSFVWYASRNVSPGQVRIYSPYGNASVKYFDNTANGTNDTATASTTVTQGTISTAIQYTAVGYHFLSSTLPVLVSIEGSGDTDLTILNPAENVVYNRYAGFNASIYNTTASLGNAYAFSVANNIPSQSNTIGDGAGGATASGLGKSRISDRYAFGNVLSDYTIVVPNDNTIVCSYWNGSAWIAWDTHTITGATELNPTRNTRDGTNGPGAEASTVSGTATNMASGATLWKWEGTDVFYLGINDSQDDESSMYGWMSTNETRVGSYTPLGVFDVSGNQNLVLQYNQDFIERVDGGLKFTRTPATEKKLGGMLSVNVSGALNPQTFLYNDHSWEFLFRIDDQNPGTYDGNEAESIIGVYRGTHFGLSYSSTQVRYLTWNGTTLTNTVYVPIGTGANQVTVGQWEHIIVTLSGLQFKMYLNGILVSTYNAASHTVNANIQSDINFGAARSQPNAVDPYTYYSKSTLALSRMYNRALSEAEVEKNFNSVRGRYGL